MDLLGQQGKEKHEYFSYEERISESLREMKTHTEEARLLDLGV